MTKYLVTGGVGFIGSHVVERLLYKGAKVRVLDNLSTGRLENIHAFSDDVELIQGDVRALDVVRAAADRVERIIHLAARPSVQRSIADPLMTHDVNVTGTLNVLIAARDMNVQRVVFASSSSIYGNSPVLPRTEAATPAPISPYAVSKLASEHYCAAFTAIYGLPTIALRYFNVYGPRQDPNSDYAAVIPRFINCLLRGESPIIFGSGHQSRDFTYVENVVVANLLAAEAPSIISGHYNVATGHRVMLLDLVSHIQEVLGTDINVQHAERPIGDIDHSHADLSRIRKVLGFEPRIGLREGLTQTTEFYRLLSSK